MTIDPDLIEKVRAELHEGMPVRFIAGSGPLMTVTKVLPTHQVKVEWQEGEITRRATFPRGMLAIGHETAEEAGQLPINTLQAKIHQTALIKGWWENGERNVGELLALIHSEVSEALECYRNGHDVDDVWIEDGKPEGVFVELADVIIRILDAAGWYEMDMAKILAVKMKYNERRPRRHGGKRV